VGSDCGKGPQSAGQVSDEKTNMVEPLLTHRDYLMMASKAGRHTVLGQWRAFVASPQPGSCLYVALVVPGVKVA
jgi:hypothetical protein